MLIQSIHASQFGATILETWQEIAGANLAVIPGCSHAVHLEKPQLFNAMLQDFLGNE